MYQFVEYILDLIAEGIYCMKTNMTLSNRKILRLFKKGFIIPDRTHTHTVQTLCIVKKEVDLMENVEMVFFHLPYDEGKEKCKKKKKKKKTGAYIFVAFFVIFSGYNKNKILRS